MALPEVGLQAVLEGVAEFERGAQTLQDAYAKLSQGAQMLADDSEASAKRTTSAWDSIAQLMSLGALQQVAGSAGQVGNQLLGMAKSATLTAARAEELDAVLANLAERNNLSAAAMRNQVAAIKEQGITTSVASNLVSQFVRSNLDLEKASKLARIAQDAAVISMEDSSQALQGLLHGVLTLQPEILRYRGIIVDLQGEYTRWAQANGRAVQSLTGAEKQMIALDAVIEQGTSIAGTYESAMGTASKQMRSFSRYVEELREDFGQALLPVFTEAVFTAKDFTKALMGLPEPLKAGVAMAGALTGGLLKGTSAMVGFGAQVAQISLALKTLASAERLAALGILGPAGLVAALVAVVGLGVYSAIKANEEAHRDEAAAVLAASETYDEYVREAERAELGSYTLSESLYEIAKGAAAAKDGVDALALTEAWRELELFFGIGGTGIEWLDEFADKLPKVGVDVESAAEQLGYFVQEWDAARLAVIADEEALRAIGVRLGLTGDDLEDFIARMQDVVREHEMHEAAVQASEGREEEYWKRLIDTNDELRQRARDLETMEKYGELANEMLDYAIIRERDYASALERSNRQIRAKAALTAMGEQLSARAAGKILDAEKKADEDREEARARLMDSLTDLEEDHASRVADILEAMADTDADLLDDMVQADADYQKERLALQQQYTDEIAQAEADLAQAQADARKSLLRDLEDIERKYTQRREDEARDLARDLEDIERDLVTAQEGVWADYYAELESLAEDHGQRMADISEKYANERAAIEEKYRTEATQEEIREAEREALMAQLEELRSLQAGGLTGIDYTQAVTEVLAALDELKQQELAALEAAQAEEVAAEEAAYAERQAKAAERREAELAAEVAAYEERKAERDRQYQQSLEDLTVSLGRETDERRRRYQEQLADLKADHQAELAEIEQANVERAAKLDQRLADEKAKLVQATADRKAQLVEQLGDERANYAERQTELETAYATQKETIDTELAKKTGAIQEDLNLELAVWLDHWKAVDQGTYDALKNMVENNIHGWVDRAIGEFQRLQDEAARLGMVGQSPAPWWLKMGQSWGQGLEKGFPVDRILGGVETTFRGFQGIMGQPSRVAQVAPTTYNQPSRTTNNNQRTVNLNYTGQQYSEPSLQALATMTEMRANA